MSSLEELIEEIVAFRDERDWGQFHRPEQLATAVSIEAADLQELFLWKNEAQVQEALSQTELRREARREIADVLIFAFLFCERLDLDIERAIGTKLKENAEKYPIDRAKGLSDKYTKLDKLD